MEYLDDGNRFSLIKDGKEVGYLLYRKEEDNFNIYKTYINEEFRHQGYAKALVEAFKSQKGDDYTYVSTCEFVRGQKWMRLINS